MQCRLWSQRRLAACSGDSSAVPRDQERAAEAVSLGAAQASSADAAAQLAEATQTIAELRHQLAGSAGLAERIEVLQKQLNEATAAAEHLDLRGERAVAEANGEASAHQVRAPAQGLLGGVSLSGREGRACTSAFVVVAPVLSLSSKDCILVVNSGAIGVASCRRGGMRGRLRSCSCSRRRSSWCRSWQRQSAASPRQQNASKPTLPRGC